MEKEKAAAGRNKPLTETHRLLQPIAIPSQPTLTETSRQLLTVDDAAARTGRKASTWRRDILLGRIPVVHVGRLVRIPVEYIDQVCKDGMPPAQADAGRRTATASR